MARHHGVAFASLLNTKHVELLEDELKDGGELVHVHDHLACVRLHVPGRALLQRVQPSLEHGHLVMLVGNHRAARLQSLHHAKRHDALESLRRPPALHLRLKGFTVADLCSHARDELLTVERLLDVVHAARLKAALDVVDAAVGGDHDDWDGDAGVALVDRLADFVSVHVWHHDVQQHDVGEHFARLEEIESVLAAHGLLDPVALEREQLRNDVLVDDVVVHAEDHAAAVLLTVERLAHA
mmetsp:Transcript_40492/g.120789  ORF Transcript_40492/g.120789 Transcript_40492/m.120789 type:complete len:240 (-) Transcript_40492:2164-2883(-)